MAGMTDLAIRIATTLDATGINKADKSVKKLDATVSKLGRTLGIALSTAAVVAYGKSAVRAFANMEAQQVRLSRLMKVGTGATDFQIQALNKQAAALENLGVVSKGNVTQVQSQLATFNLQASTIAALTPAILDYVTAEKGATASTEEFKMMTNGLAQALNGNFTSLTRVGFVIDQNTRDLIKNGTEAQRVQAIVKVLDSTYKGFNASLRDTTAGKLQLLTNAAEDAKEAIGEGLVDALAKLGGGSEVKDAVKTLDTIAKSINVITNVTATAIGSLVKLYKALDFVTSFGGRTGGSGEFAKYADSVEERLRQFDNPRSKSPAGTALRMRLAREQAAAAKKQLDATKKLTGEQKKLTAEQKKQNSLKKSATVFDLDQIQLIAALKGKLSEEDRNRIEAQLALLNNNDALATKLTREILMAQDATGGLYRYFLTIGDAKIKNPFAFLDEWIMEFQNKLNNLKVPAMPTAVSAAVAPTSGVVLGFTPTPMNPIATTGAIQGPQIPSTNASNFTGTIPTGNFTYGQGNPLNTNVYVTVQGSVTTEDDLVKKIASGLQNQSLSTGDSAYINRRTGGFAG
jgi:hypothetical protein